MKLRRDGAEIHYEVYGKGPAVVFAHGLGGNHLSWWQQVAHFAPSRTCVVFAHRGFPPSSPVPGKSAPDAYADDLAALVKELKLEDVALVAQSMGGWTCLEYALRHTGKVRALVMASTSGRLDFNQLENKEIQEWVARSPAALADLQKRGIHSAGGERLYREQPALAQLYAQISELAPASFRDEVRVRIRELRKESPSLLAKLPMPVLFITGDEDWVFPPAAGPAFAKLAPKGSAVRVPAAGHSVYFERAAKFNELIRENDLKTVLITGATGDVGTHLTRELAGKYKLRLSDKRPLKAKNFVKADISKMADALRITKGVDAIVHLGGYSVEGPWESILQANIIGCYHVFEAARRNGVKRIVFPTSNHATGFYRRDQTIDHRVYPKPDSRYGVSKVFGEALGSLYADKYGMEFMMVRIGNVNPAPLDKRRLSLWISPRDIAQLVSIGIDHPEIKFEIVYGVSGNKRNWYDNANAFRLGYKPQDDSEPYAQEVLAKEKPATDRIAEMYQGGVFCTAEAVPNPAAPVKKSKKKK